MTEIKKTESPKNKGPKRKKGPRCPYCGEQVDIEQKGRLLNCLTCGNDSLS